MNGLRNNIIFRSDESCFALPCFNEHSRLRQTGQRADYLLPTNELVCREIFANKISGAKKNEERSEIMEMIDYVQTHEIDRVCA